MRKGPLRRHCAWVIQLYAVCSEAPQHIPTMLYRRTPSVSGRPNDVGNAYNEVTGGVIVYNEILRVTIHQAGLLTKAGEGGTEGRHRLTKVVEGVP